MTETQIGVVGTPLGGLTSRGTREGALHVGTQLRVGDGHTWGSPRLLLVCARQPKSEVLCPAASLLGLRRHTQVEERRSRIFKSSSGGQLFEASFLQRRLASGTRSRRRIVELLQPLGKNGVVGCCRRRRGPLR